MTRKKIQDFCMTLPGVTEDVKWEQDLCFLVGNKIFCMITTLGDLTISFKALSKDFEILTKKPGIQPSQYLAKYEWVTVKQITVLTETEIEKYITQSYELIKSKLPKKQRELLK